MSLPLPHQAGYRIVNRVSEGVHDCAFRFQLFPSKPMNRNQSSAIATFLLLRLGLRVASLARLLTLYNSPISSNELPFSKPEYFLSEFDLVEAHSRLGK